MKKVGHRIFNDVKKFWPAPIILVILYFLLHKLEGAFCPMVRIFGLPCPGCGITRALLYVLKGQFEEAFYINPCVYLWILFLLYIIVVRYLLGKPLKHGMAFAVIILGIMLIRYCHGMYLYYPDRPPFAYTGGNKMEDIIPGYMHMVRDFNFKF
jgi:hypothetical protein